MNNSDEAQIGRPFLIQIDGNITISKICENCYQLVEDEYISEEMKFMITSEVDYNMHFSNEIARAIDKYNAYMKEGEEDNDTEEGDTE